jgi:hypothetical protein
VVSELIVSLSRLIDAVVVGFHLLVIFKLLGIVGDAHRFDNVKLVPFGKI